MFDLYRWKQSLFVLVVLAISIPAAAAEEHEHAVTPPAEAGSPAAGANEPVKTKLKIGKTDTLIQVEDLHCKSCAKKVSRKLYAVKGVVKVRTDVAADVAVVTPQKKKKLDAKALWSAAQKAGFQPVRLEGPAGKYQPDPKTKAPVLVPAEVASKAE